MCRLFLFLLVWTQAAFSQNTTDAFCYQIQRMLSAGLYDNFELLTITSDRQTLLSATPDLSVTIPGFEKGYVDKDNHYIAIMPLFTDSATAVDSLHNVWLHTANCLPTWQSSRLQQGALTTFLHSTGTGYLIENRQFTIRLAIIKKEVARFVVTLIAKRKK